MSKGGSIKPSTGSLGKGRQSAIKKVSGPQVLKSTETNSASAEVLKTSSELGSQRPGSQVDAENKQNENDKGEVSKDNNNQSPRTFSSSNGSFEERFINRIWGRNGAQRGIGAAGSFGGSSGGAGAIPVGSSGSFTPLAGGSGGALGGGSSGSSGGGATSSGSGGSNKSYNNSRQFIDKDGNVRNIDDGDNIRGRRGNPDDGQIRGNPEKFNHDQGGKDPYEKVNKIDPKHKPSGTGEKLENYRAKLSTEDQKIYDKLDSLVKVYRNDSVGFGTNLSNASTAREAGADKRDQVLAMLTDSIKKESPEVQNQILSNLDSWGKQDGAEMKVFLSDKLSFGMNKSVGGFVASGEGFGSEMALPLDLSDYTHTDIARHEGVHWKDVVSDGQLDGLVAGEDKEIQNLMLEAMRKFEAGEYDKDKIEKLDVGNLRYGSGYYRKLAREGEGKKTNPDDAVGVNKAFALGEARAVLEQEFSDKPEEFKAVGEEFAKLAEHWEDNVATHDESAVQKDGKEDGTAMS